MGSWKHLFFGACASAALVVTACAPNTSGTSTTTTTTLPDSGRYVAVTGADTGDCSASASPCLTIGYAVAQAATGETVHVGAGTYGELVSVTKSLTFEGANHGRHAGVAPAARTAESVVKGFRTPGEPHPAAASGEFSVTVDGFTIDPQGDAALIAAPTHHLVSLFGGPLVSVRNNVFSGGPWVADCGYDCTTMTDAAVMVQSGTYEVKDNSFTNFRSPVDVTQFDAAHPVVSGSFTSNTFSHVTNRALWVNEYQGGPFPGTITISGNQLDATGWTSPTWSPAGIVVTSGGNTITGNTFTGFGSGVFVQVCDGTNVASDANSFTGNTFAGNRSGIQVYVVGACGPTVVNATITGNQFDGGLWSGAGLVDVPKIGVRWNGATRPNDLTAECNWWGASTGPDSPGASTTTAGVDATPWQSAANGACDGV